MHNVHLSVFTGHSKIVAILVKSGADTSASDSNGATALHYAAQNNFSVRAICLFKMLSFNVG